MNKKKKMFWKSHTEYVDIETGELLTEQEFKKNYIKLNNEKKYTIKNANYGTVKNTTSGKRHNYGKQGTFW